ncbi:MAG: hypothetical protein Aurels2KO_26290 [Aureliella sp.]
MGQVRKTSIEQTKYDQSYQETLSDDCTPDSHLWRKQYVAHAPTVLIGSVIVEGSLPRSD